MRKIKSYFVFTSFLYRLVMFVAIPTVLLVLLLYFPYIQYVQVALVVFIEIMSDHWLFGGICSKEVQTMDYLKSSPKGMQVLKNALVSDTARRFLYTVLWLGISSFYTKFHSQQVSPTKAMHIFLVSGTAVLIIYSLTMIGVIVNRFFDNFWLKTFCAYVVILLVYLGLQFLQIGIETIVIAPIAAMTVSIFAVRVVMIKIKKSYYDSPE